MHEQFYSEDGVDAWLAQSGLLPATGVYVDAGCAHPWKYSQTAFLRNRGWTGLAIDGDSAYGPEWVGIPNATFVNALLSDKTQERFLVEPTNALVSRVHEVGMLMDAFTLDYVMECNDLRTCDFLSLDIEGMETRVLEDFLMPRSVPATPRIIVAEYNSEHKGRDVSLFNMMAKTIFKLVHLTNSNAVFARL